MIVPFPARPREPCVGDFRLKVTLRKRGHSWFYQILPTGVSDAQTWVRYDGLPHRAEMVHTPYAAERIYQQYLREIASLEQDGWHKDPAG